jgi:hypothetical protein
MNFVQNNIVYNLLLLRSAGPAVRPASDGPLLFFSPVLHPPSTTPKENEEENPPFLPRWHDLKAGCCLQVKGTTDLPSKVKKTASHSTTKFCIEFRRPILSSEPRCNGNFTSLLTLSDSTPALRKVAVPVNQVVKRASEERSMAHKIGISGHVVKR